MIWAEALADLNDIELATFGQPVTLVTARGVPTTIPGLFTAAYAGGQDPTRSPFARPDPRVTVRTAELAATGASVGHRLTVDGRTYVIADLIADGGGMTDLVLRTV